MEVPVGRSSRRNRTHTGHTLTSTLSEMWGKGKKRTDDGPAGGGSDGAPPSKRFAKSDSDDNSIIVCELSKNRKVSVRNWNGKIGVDIREFYVKDGKELPGKKGIQLTMDQWKILREHIDDITEAVAENA